MALRIEGRVMQITPIETGEGARGTWQKRMLVIETLEQFPRKVAFVAWGERAQALDSLRPGERVVVDFTIESRTFNDRWYTDAKLFGVKVVKEEEVVPSSFGPNTSAGVSQPASQPNTQTQDNPLDDLSQDDSLDDYGDLLDDTDDMLDNGLSSDDDFFAGDDDADDDLPF